MQMPNRAQAREGVSNRMTDRMRSSASTILTSGRGVMQEGETERKTLLGQ